MKDCEEKSQTCVGCSDCQTHQKALWKAVNNAVIVIEYMENMEEAIKTVIQEISYSPEVHALWDAYDKYKVAIKKWRESHEIQPRV